MQIRSAFYIILLILSLIYSCTLGYDTAAGTPRCIELEMKDFYRHVSCDNASVTEFIFQEQTVYLFGSGNCCCDHGSPVFNEHCVFLGSLGGFTGNEEINGEEFGNAIFVRTIWEK